MDDGETDGRAGHVTGQDLSRLSVADLEAAIAGLREEIARIETEIAARAASRSAADAVFRK